MGENWLKRHPEHYLDPLSLRDLAVSAFRGKNLDPQTGDLGKFLVLVREGRIAKGSILMVERLDRFSRMPPSKSIKVLSELVGQGVNILTLDPEQMITPDNLDDMQVWLPINIHLQIAYEQSREKKNRVSGAWKAAREAVRNGSRKKIFGQIPNWLEHTEEGGFRVKPQGRKAVEYIYKRTIEGCGQKLLTHELNAKFEPLGRSGKWNGSYIQKVLSDRAVLGEFQPYRFTDNGERVEDGKPIQDYYPR